MTGSVNGSCESQRPALEAPRVGAMNERGVRRGLAAAAVGALAMSGLTMTLTAAPSYAAESGDVRLISQRGGVASTRPDGAGSFTPGIRLTAARLDTSATVVFEVNPDPHATDATPGWTGVGMTDTSDPGFVHADWDGTLGGDSLVGTRVSLRASATVGGEAPTYSTVNDVLVSGPTSPAEAARITTFSGGYFVQPYADSGRTKSLLGVSGETSATDGAVALTPWRNGATAFGGRVDAAVEPGDIKIQSQTPVPGSESIYADGGAFRGVLALAAFEAQDGDSVAVRATRDSDEVAAATLHPQQISAFGSGATRATSAGTHVDLVVTDTGSYPVAGAEVRRLDGTLVGYTDGAGIVEVLQENDSSQTYYVNTTDADAYQGGTDLSVEVSVPAYTAAPSGLRAVLADGPVFDDSEYAAGDIALQVVDQEGKPFPGAREVSYALYPSAGPAAARTSAFTNAAGRLVVPFDPADPDGHYTLERQGPDGIRRSYFVAGDTTLGLDPAQAAATSGGAVAITGQLSVGEWPLAGRSVALTFRQGTELVPGTGADAGILAGGKRRLAASVASRADGTFVATVDDPSEVGRPTETTGTLRAAALGATDTATVAFGSGKGTLQLRLKGTSKGGAADRLVAKGGPTLQGERVKVLTRAGRKWKPVKTVTLGRTGSLTLTVKDKNGAAKTAYRVQLLASDRARPSTSNTVTLA